MTQTDMDLNRLTTFCTCFKLATPIALPVETTTQIAPYAIQATFFSAQIASSDVPKIIS